MATQSLPEEKAKKVLKRHANMLTKRSSWELTWKELTEYIVPHKSNLGNEVAPGQKQTSNLFDSTAIEANDLLAASIGGSVTSAAIRWFGLQTHNEDVNAKTSVREYLDRVANTIYLVLRQSNFHSESHEFYLDITAIGTAAIFMEAREDTSEKKFNGLRFTTLAPGTYCISENAEGHVNVLFRTFKRTLEAAAEEFGEEQLAPAVKSKLASKPDDEIEILHAVFPNKKGTRGAPDAKNYPYSSLYLDIKNKHILSEGGFRAFPYMCSRWAKSSGEMYGRGPGHTALPDIKSLNKYAQLDLKAGALAIAPVLLRKDDGVVGKIRTTPNAIITVRGEHALTPLVTGVQYQVADQKMLRLEAKIRHIFFWDQLQLPTGPGGPMTATEVERRYELMQRLLGPTLGRLETEFLNPLISRVLDILTETGQIEPPPPELLDLLDTGADTVMVKYEGPLARAQRGNEVASIEKMLTTVTLFAQVDVAYAASILQNFDPDRVADFLASVNGMPAKLKKKPEQLAQERAAAAEQQQLSLGLEQTKVGTEAMSNVASAGKSMADAEAELQPEQQGELVNA